MINFTPALRPFLWATMTAVAMYNTPHAAADTPRPTGYILNDSGQKCGYTQSIQPTAKYFHTLPGPSYRLVFDAPTCMKDAGMGLDVNKMMINNIIVKNYSHSDAKFLTRSAEMFRTSRLQVKGACIQSEKYPMTAVAVEYESDGKGIQAVRHAMAIGPCSN